MDHSEKEYSTLRSGVDNIDLMHRDSMNDFLSLLQFSFGTLHESHTSRGSVEVSSKADKILVIRQDKPGSGKTSS